MHPPVATLRRSPLAWLPLPSPGTLGSSVVALWLAAAAVAAPDFQRRASMTDAGVGRALAPAEGRRHLARAEAFLLAPERPERNVGRDAEGLAVLAQHRLVVGDVTLLEREVQFEEGHLRVLHTERIRGTRRTLTWRELRPDGARTWTAEWDVRGGEGRVVGYGWRRAVHETFVAPVGLLGPLEHLEGLRSGALPPLPFEAPVLDPLSASVEVLRTESAPAAAQGTRRLRVLRLDRTLQLEVTLGPVPGEIVALRFHDGDHVARPVSRDEFDRRHAAWNEPRVPAHERALAWIRSAR